MVSWDEPKRQLNINDHQLDFTGCDGVFDGPVITFEDVISLRKATKHEARYFFSKI